MTSKQSTDKEHDLRKMRDSCLMAELHRKMRDPRLRHMSYTELLWAAAASPAPSFFITYDYAMRVWNLHCKGRLRLGDSVNSSKWTEIITRVSRLVEQRGVPPREAVSRVIAQPAPSYYLKPDSAAKAFRRLRHRRKTASETRDF